MDRKVLRTFVLEHGVLPAAGVLTQNQGWRYLQEFLASDHEDPATRKARQWRRLGRLLEHAHANVPYYRAVFERAGCLPGDIRTPDDLRRLPVTTKQDLRDHFPDGILAGNIDLRTLRFSNTSGTAGGHLVLAQDQRDINYKYASKLRTRHMMGASVGDKVLRLAPNECQPAFPDGTSPDVGSAELARMWLTGDDRRSQAWFSFVERRIVNPLFHRRDFPPPLPRRFDETHLARYLDQIVEGRPQVLAGHPIYLYLVARLREKLGTPINGIQAVDCTGDLSTDRLRGYLSQQFGAPVFQIYGGCELGRIGGSCGHSGGPMHLLEDICFVELLGPDGAPVGPGELGNLVVTWLTNDAMPLIRYEMGDVGRLHDRRCDCGRTAPLFDITGRLQDVFVDAEGRIRTPTDLLDLLVEYPGMGLFQLIQQAPDRYEFRYTGDSDDTLDRGALERSLRATLGERSRIELTQLDHVALAPSGKFRFVSSSSYETFRCARPTAPELGAFW